MEEEEVEAEVLPPPVVEPVVDLVGVAEGLPVDPVADPAEAEALQRDHQDSRLRGQKGI